MRAMRVWATEREEDDGAGQWLGRENVGATERKEEVGTGTGWEREMVGNASYDAQLLG